MKEWDSLHRTTTFLRHQVLTALHTQIRVENDALKGVRSCSWSFLLVPLSEEMVGKWANSGGLWLP